MYSSSLLLIKELKKENKELKEEVLSLKKQFASTGSDFLSRPLFRDIIDSINEAIYIQDENGVFLDVNHSAEIMYGYPRESFIGKTPEFLSAPGKNDLKSIEEKIQKTFEGKRQRFEFWGIDNNKRVFPKEVSLTLGNFMGQKAIIAVGREIAESYNAKKKLQERERMYNTLINNLQKSTL